MFDIENGNLILKEVHRKEIKKIYEQTHKPGEGNALFHSIKYLKEESSKVNSFVPLPILKKIIESLED
jgi:hypothetical protein